ncbi:hypothetical protein Pfo_005082, partial [Paulownia fortunei]
PLLFTLLINKAIVKHFLLCHFQLSQVVDSSSSSLDDGITGPLREDQDLEASTSCQNKDPKVVVRIEDTFDDSSEESEESEPKPEPPKPWMLISFIVQDRDALSIRRRF